MDKNFPNCEILGHKKQRILKESIDKWLIMYQWSQIKFLADFSAETLQSRRHWDVYLKYWMEENLINWKSCIGKTVLQNKGEIKAFQDKQNLERIIIIRTSLPEILKGVLQAEMKKC